MMEKFFHSLLKGWSSEVSPSIKLKLDVLKLTKDFGGCCQVDYAFETRFGSEAFEDDPEKMEYSCRLSQLNGYGCFHLCSTISFLNREVNWYVI